MLNVHFLGAGQGGGGAAAGRAAAPTRRRALQQKVVLSPACGVKMANYSPQHKILHIQTRQVEFCIT